MKLNPIGLNMTEVEVNENVTIFFSYKTPVAAFVSGEGYLKTEKKWSVTTSRHINKWLDKIGGVGTSAIAQTRPQEFFDNLIN